MSERVPPSNVAAEEALLGAIMYAKRLRVEIAARVEEADFWLPTHRTIRRAIDVLADAGDPITPVTVLGRLQATGELDCIGGAPFIHTLVEAAGTAAEAEHYAKIVAEKSMLRRLIDTGTRIAQAGYEARDAGEAVAEAERSSSGSAVVVVAPKVTTGPSDSSPEGHSSSTHPRPRRVSGASASRSHGRRASRS